MATSTANSPTHYPTVVINGRAPFFDGNNFNLWKVRFRCYLQSLGPISFDAISKDYYIETNVYNAGLSENQKAIFIADGKVKDALLQSLNNVDLERVINCNSAYKMWKVLEVTHEGAENVKLAKRDQLTTQFENFHMLENESIDEMFNRFCHITNGLASLGEEISNDKKIRKILRSLTPKWQIKATTLREVNDISKLSIEALQGSLKTHELELAEMEERTNDEPKKKTVAFKVSSNAEEETTDDEDINFEDLALFTKKMSKFFQRRGRNSNFQRGDRRKTKAPKGREIKGPCYICDKHGHFAANCPSKIEKSSDQSKDSKTIKENKFVKVNKRSHKANMAATWDDSEDSDSDQSSSGDEVANSCFMAHDKKPCEVYSSLNNPSSIFSSNCFMALEEEENLNDQNLDDSDITLDEALFEYEKLLAIHIDTKKKLESYKRKYENYSVNLESLRNERDMYKEKYENILKEVDLVKTRVEKVSDAMHSFDVQKFITMHKTLIKGKYISASPTISPRKMPNVSKTHSHASTSYAPPASVSHKQHKNASHLHKKTYVSHEHTHTHAHQKKKEKFYDAPKHTHHKHKHHSHARKVHHAFYYTPMTCEYCGRNGHIEKFCYDKLRSISHNKNRFSWKRNTNGLEPKVIWVPKCVSPTAGSPERRTT